MSRPVGPGLQAGPGVRDGPGPACAFERSRHGLGESLGPAITPPEPCTWMRAVPQHTSPPDGNARHPQTDGHPQGQRAPSLLHAPRCCVLARSRILAVIPTPRACPPVKSYRMEINRGFLEQPAWRQPPGAVLWGEGSPGQRSARHVGGHPGTVHQPPTGAQQDARGWHGPWGAGPGAGSGPQPARSGWGVQHADAGCYDGSICWLLVCLLFNFFFLIQFTLLVAVQA